MTWQMLHAIFSFIQSSVNHPSKQNALFLKSSDDIIDRQGVEGEFKGLYHFRLSYPRRGGKGRGEVLLGLIFAGNMPLALQ